MTAAALLQHAADLGLTVTPAPGGRLLVCPPGKLPTDLRRGLRAGKPAILDLLRRRAGVRDAFAAAYGRIAVAFPEGVGRALDLRPDLVRAIEAAELEADGVALLVLAGTAEPPALDAAIQHWEGAWLQAAGDRS